MRQAEDAVCRLTIASILVRIGHKCLQVSETSSLSSLDRSCREQNPIVVDTEVNALISENSNDTHAVICIDPSIVHHQWSIWVFIARSSDRTVQKACGAFAMMTSRMKTEIMAVIRFIWPELQDYTPVCVLSDSISVIRKVQMGSVRRKWLESLQRSRICSVTFIFVPD